MNKNELVNLVSERIEGGKAAASSAVDAVFETIEETVSRGEKVAISGFGVFERVERAARTGRNPATGERVEVKASSVPKFRPGSQFKAYVSGTQELVRGAVKTARSTAASGVRAAAEQIAPEQEPAKKATRARSTAQKSTAQKSTARKSTARKSTAQKSTTQKSTARKAVASPSTAAKSTAAKSTAAKSTAAKSTAAKATGTRKATKKASPGSGS